MDPRFRRVNYSRMGLLTLALGFSTAGAAVAQQVDPALPQPASDAPAPPEVTNEPALAPPAPPSIAEAASTPELSAATKEPSPVDALGPLNISFWSRVDLVLSDGEELDEQYSTGQFELHASGKVHEIVSLTTNFVASYNADVGVAGEAAVLDGIIQIEPSELFNLWLGRMLVPVDRSNFSGPWFMAPWFFPGFGFVDGQVTAPREGPFGRNDGVTLWGELGGGVLKYYAGAFDLYEPAMAPLFSGRLSLHLLNPEHGFYGSSTFYGKDLLGIGVGFQSKRDGSIEANASGVPVRTDQYTELNVDVLFEKTLGGFGVLDLEGAFYKFNGDFERTAAGWYALASYLMSAEIGGGKLQPLVRVQQAIPAAGAEPTSTLVDVQIGFVVSAYAARFALGYRKGQAGDADSQALYLGAQLQK